jgi:NAD(P)-dependent dehydrogenase (short-subunit alcohol dehydrogenase family)/uncharacterized protein YndB with AHSA1/START domain
MQRLKTDLVIDAPRHMVWDALVDIEAVVTWNPGIDDVECISRMRSGVGATRRCYTHPTGWMTESVTAWVDRELIVFDIEDAAPLKNGTARYQLADERGGTRLAASFDYEVKLGPLGPVIDRLIVHKQLGTAWNGALEGLKDFTETQSRGFKVGGAASALRHHKQEKKMETVTTALVTGATSGLGFEAAAQLADQGASSVIITGRTEERASQARDALVERTGKEVFTTLVVDLNRPVDVKSAADELADRGVSIDFLLLNAGMVSGSTLVKTDEDIEITFASSLIGHHELTMGLLEDGVLSDNASIVIAGSEAARGDVPTFSPTDLGSLADKSFDGDLVAAAEGIIRADESIKYKPATAYADAKVFVAWWSAQLATRLPEGMTVNAVSPGSVPRTEAGRNANFFMKYVMLPAFKYAPKKLGMGAHVSSGAGRYIEVAGYDDGVSGHFFASAPKKMTGSIEAMQMPHFHDPAYQQAAWSAVVNVSGGVDYPVNA